jgi:hypothetical protein
MDPIHPIVPQPPIFPPVEPTQISGRVNRDEQRDPELERERQRRRRQAEQERRDREAGRDDEPGDGRPHIDVTA